MTNNRPTVGELRRILEATLVPLLSGSELGLEEKETMSATECISVVRKNRILLQPDSSTGAVFQLTRPQGYCRVEVQLANVGLLLIKEALSSFGSTFFPDMLQALARRAIAKCLGYSNEQLLLDVLDAFESLSAQTYEGHRIAAAIGLDSQSVTDGVFYGDVQGEDFVKVLTSGIDTMLVVAPNGHIHTYRTLYSEARIVEAPYHTRMIAEWTIGDRVSVILNRNGEILVLKNKQLAFAKRRGVWHHFVHEPILSVMKSFCSIELAECVYETCLDVSFARTGGCIAIVRRKNGAQVKNLVAEQDLLSLRNSPKAAVIGRLIEDRAIPQKFQDLSRRFRQSLAAIDGATVLSHKGDILAVGAIVRLPGGSESGARRAAAKALGQLGMGIKISADGAIAGFSQKTGNEQSQLAFQFT